MTPFLSKVKTKVFSKLNTLDLSLVLYSLTDLFITQPEYNNKNRTIFMGLDSIEIHLVPNIFQSLYIPLLETASNFSQFLLSKASLSDGCWLDAEETASFTLDKDKGRVLLVVI